MIKPYFSNITSLFSLTWFLHVKGADFNFHPETNDHCLHGNITRTDYATRRAWPPTRKSTHPPMEASLAAHAAGDLAITTTSFPKSPLRLPHVAGENLTPTCHRPIWRGCALAILGFCVGFSLLARVDVAICWCRYMVFRFFLEPAEDLRVIILSKRERPMTCYNAEAIGRHHRQRNFVRPPTHKLTPLSGISPRPTSTPHPRVPLIKHQSKCDLGGGRRAFEDTSVPFEP
jgi:hypothetical protein